MTLHMYSEGSNAIARARMRQGRPEQTGGKRREIKRADADTKDVEQDSIRMHEPGRVSKDVHLTAVQSLKGPTRMATNGQNTRYTSREGKASVESTDKGRTGPPISSNSITLGKRRRQMVTTPNKDLANVGANSPRLELSNALLEGRNLIRGYDKAKRTAQKGTLDGGAPPSRLQRGMPTRYTYWSKR